MCAPPRSAASTAVVADSTVSPSTMSSSRPYRSAMWCGCHGVCACHSAQIGTVISANAIARNASGRTDPGTNTTRGPADLADDDARRVAQPDPPAARVLPGRPQPQRDQPEPHDHVPEPDHRDVTVERPGHPGREYQHPGDLHEHREPVRHVVGVVGGGEPGEVHPRPPDREEHHQVPDQPVPDLAGQQGVVQPIRALCHGDHEAQVEEEFQRGRRAVAVPGSRPHRAYQPMLAQGHASLCRAGRVAAGEPGGKPRNPATWELRCGDRPVGH